VAALLAVLTLIFVGAVHGFDGEELAKGYDWAEQFTFQRDFLAESLERREAPLWCPYTFGGRPFYADPQTMVFYPGTLTWLLLPKMTAFTVDVIVHYFLAALFTFLFVRSLNVRPAFALLAGILFAFSGFNLHHITAGHINFHAAVAWIPLVFWCVERAAGERRVFWLWGGGALGLQFLAGSIPVSWMTFLFAGLYGAVRGCVPFQPRRAMAVAGGLAVLFALAIGIAAVQLLPTMEFASLGVRPPSSYEYSTYQDLPPRNLVNLVFPQGKIDGPELEDHEKLIPEGEFNGYIGILGLGLGLAGLTLLRRAPVPALLAMALLALPLMLGDATPLFRLFWWALPGVSRLRFHCREILMLSFALSAAGAIAAEEFARARRERMLDLSFWIGAGLLGALTLAGLSLLAGNPTAPNWQIGIIVAAFAGLWLARRHAATAVVAAGLAAFAFADITTNAVHFDTYYAQVRAPAPSTEELLSATIREDGGLYRAFFHKRAYRRERFIADRFPTVDGYEAMIPRGWYGLIHALCDTPIKDYLVAEATQNIFSRRPSPFPFRILNVKYTTIRQPNRTYRLLANPDPDPRAWLASQATVIADDEAATRLLKSADFDPRRTVILASEPPGFMPTITPPRPDEEASAAGTNETARTLSPDGRVSTTEAGRTEILSWGLNTIRVKTKAASPAVLVVSEGFYPGWRATVDGEDAPVLRAHVVLRGVPLPAGEHEVVLRFRPRPLRVGGAITLFSLLGMGIAAYFVGRAGRRGGEAAG
jgi:hypothetical protein